MERVQQDADWSLMCPHESPGLENCWGKEFEDLYHKYESEGKFKKKVKARHLWYAIIESQVETGTPYMLYKDACNRKSNQQNLGTIKCSNLCTEIVEYSSPDEVAVCNLASIALNMFVKQDKTFDFDKLKSVTKVITYNLNKIIEVNYYPVKEAENSNKRHRPIGIGVQGLADTFMLMRFPFESDDAKLLNQQIFETIYYGAMEASCELAQKDGPYSTYAGSPVSKGVFQFDMWEVTPTPLHGLGGLEGEGGAVGACGTRCWWRPCRRLDGADPRQQREHRGVHLERVLPQGALRRVPGRQPPPAQRPDELGVWDDHMKNQLIAANGSVQGIAAIPDDLKKLYKTVWEISQKTVLEMAADRAPS
ncbi:UNVERIFIED_CONTAM: hypothetical protein GTU68_044746 [Idotea baltica]|nr:hypothetical protein [Idotea baltica]